VSIRPNHSLHPECAWAPSEPGMSSTEYLRIFHNVPCILVNDGNGDVEVASSRADVTQFAIPVALLSDLYSMDAGLKFSVNFDCASHVGSYSHCLNPLSQKSATACLRHQPSMVKRVTRRSTTCSAGLQ
jgi:hypothetical protein